MASSSNNVKRQDTDRQKMEGKVKRKNHIASACSSEDASSGGNRHSCPRSAIGGGAVNSLHKTSEGRGENCLMTYGCGRVGE